MTLLVISKVITNYITFSIAVSSSVETKDITSNACPALERNHSLLSVNLVSTVLSSHYKYFNNLFLTNPTYLSISKGVPKAFFL